MKILLDTHVWIWYLMGSKELCDGLRKKIDEPKNEIWLSPISIWETLILAEKKKIKIMGDPQEWVRKALDAFPVKEASLNNEVALQSRTIKLKHNDPADRFIVATCQIYGLELASYDKMIKKVVRCLQ